MVLAELAIFPLDKGISLSPYVAKILRSLKTISSVKIELTAMGTLIEGEWKNVLGAVDQAFSLLQKDSERVYLTLKVDYKKGRSNAISQKVESVNEKL